jgi:hypothetical protein
MKEGDKVYCKKNNDVTNSENKTYIVLSISPNLIQVTVNKGCRSCDVEDSEIFARSYFINIPFERYSKFDEYFMSEKEIRTLKLKKLNENK